ncbi:MAG: hypothetical protein PHN63_04255 [Candidatus Omnitrophica bacterium]|nr:hypothetical protein [Candidatus Omnitrophota bacterium]
MSHYPHGYPYDNDIDDARIHPEAYELANNAYAMADNYFFLKKPLGIRVDYVADKFRLIAPFFASFFLSFFTLNTSYLITNIIIWIFASYSACWIGRYIFSSEKVGAIAGLLFSTSYAMIVLSSSTKGEIYQIAAYICLVAVSFYLDHFSNDTSKPALLNSLLLGTFAGIGIFAGISTAYLAAFIVVYGLLTMKFKSFMKRNAFLLLGCAAVYFIIVLFVHRSPPLQSLAIFKGFDIKRWEYAYKDKMMTHFIFSVPPHLWFGAILGAIGLKMRELKIILSLFATLLISEAIMLTASTPYYNWTISYYYLQILLPVYLLNARLLSFLIFDARKRKSVLLLAVKRSIAFIFIAVTLFTSNLGLLGNKYYYYLATRQTPIEVLYHSFFTFDNIYWYEQLAKDR